MGRLAEAETLVFISETKIAASLHQICVAAA